MSHLKSGSFFVRGGLDIDTINGCNQPIWQGYVDDDRKLKSQGVLRKEGLGSVDKLGQGYYRVRFPKPLSNTNYCVMLTAFSDGEWNKYACLYAKDTKFFEVKTADDESPNDSNFFFQVISMDGWAEE